MSPSPAADSTFRYKVAFAAASVGMLVAGADMIVCREARPPEQRPAPGQPDPQQDQRAMDCCATFYGVTYAVGRLLYRWLGAEREAAELRQWSRWHMVLLNVLGGSWLVVGGWQAWFEEAVFRPALVVGGLLVGLSAWDGWRAIRGARRGA